MKIGYIRVSTKEQNTARQETMLKEQGVEKIFTDKTSGKNAERNGLLKMLEYVRDGDTVITESYSRIARSTKDLFDITDKLKSKSVVFISLKEQIDTSSPQGEFMFTIFAGLAAFERACLLERQREGIEEAKKIPGKYKGRKPVYIDPIKFKNTYDSWKVGAITAVAAQKALNVTSTLWYRRVKIYEGKI